jgi:hypothetical protein
MISIKTVKLLVDENQEVMLVNSRIINNYLWFSFGTFDREISQQEKILIEPPDGTKNQERIQVSVIIDPLWLNTEQSAKRNQKVKINGEVKRIRQIEI